MAEYRSPLRKLVAFFRSSRDKWKAKCQQAKYELKLLKRRFANLQVRHDSWQQRYQEAAARREEIQAHREHLQVQNEKLQAQIESLSKKGAPHSWLAGSKS